MSTSLSAQLSRTESAWMGAGGRRMARACNFSWAAPRGGTRAQAAARFRPGNPPIYRVGLLATGHTRPRAQGTAGTRPQVAQLRLLAPRHHRPSPAGSPLPRPAMPPSSGSRVAQRAVQLSALALLLGASLAAAGGGGGVAPVFPAPATALAAATPASSSSFSTTSPSPSPSSGSDMDPPPPEAEQTERFSSLALFLVLALLILSFWTSYYLKVRKITAVHETIVGLFAGMFIGCVLRLTPGDQVQNMLSFSDTIMLNVLLPPIILASGYDLRQGNFFRNFAVILAFAFAGTFISAIVVGVIVWAWSLLRLEHLPLSLLDCLIFGSTLSATDPVTILAIFKSYKVDPQLYSVIFGESILNDAVSIVMFDTLSKFRGKEIALSSIFHGFGLFIIIFTLSMLLGVCFGLACSLMLKHSNLALYPELESCLVILIAYTSYFFSNSVTMSGIVSLLFCGITLKHYAYHNMSRRTQKTTKYTLSTMASVCFISSAAVAFNH